jgi:hypothetical protein
MTSADCNRFLADHNAEISSWWSAHRDELVHLREVYCWPPRLTRAESLRRRAAVVRTVSDEVRRRRTITRATAEEVLRWGFNNDTAALDVLDDERLDRALTDGFAFLLRDDAERAARSFEGLSGIGIRRVSKFLSLADEDRFGIYDSRVGFGLEDLAKGGRPLIHIPPGRGRRGTTTSFREHARAFALWTATRPARSCCRVDGAGAPTSTTSGAS